MAADHRFVVVCAALAATFAAFTPTAQSASAAEGAMLRVSGSKSGEAIVVLERSSTVAVDALRTSPQATIVGNGRMSGVVLQQLDVDEPVGLLAVVANACAGSGCRAPEAFEYVSGLQPSTAEDASVVLPPGRYRVVLLADGGPVSVRLQLDGLASSRSLRPRARTLATLHSVTNIDPAAGATGTFSGGIEHPSTPAGAVVLFRELYRTVAAAAAVSGTCVIYGPPPPADAYAPRCMTAESSSDRVEYVNPVVAATTGEVALLGYGHASLSPKGGSIGHYLASVTPLAAADVLQLRVPLTTPAPDSATAPAGSSSARELPLSRAPSTSASPLIPPGQARLPATGPDLSSATCGGWLLAAAGLLFARSRRSV